jgi:low temperature requirement protein LtrA
VLWWSWVGYAWLTSVLDPDEGAVRLVIFAAMAALLVAALCVPDAFGDTALLFACAYGVVRVAHIVLYTLASRGDEGLRRSVTGLAASSTVGVGLIVAAAFLDGAAQGAFWVAAIVCDMGGPLLWGVEGWRLAPRHFAERHGLFFIIALGESIVAIGVGAEVGVDAGVVVAAVLGWPSRPPCGGCTSTSWRSSPSAGWPPRRQGRARNSLARDSYSFLHFPMVAGVVLIALGLKKTLGHVGDPLKLVPAVALLGGTAMYLAAHVAFRLRNLGSLSRPRLVGALTALLLVPVAVELPALATVAALTGLLAGLVTYEAVRYAERAGPDPSPARPRRAGRGRSDP